MYTFKIILSSIVNVVPEKGLIASLLFYPVGPYWYIYVLMFYYLIFYLILKNMNTLGYAIIIFLSAIVSVFLPSKFVNEGIFIGRSYQLLYHFVYFLIGYIIYYYKDKIITFLKSSYLMTILSALTVLIYVLANDIIKIPGIKFIMTCFIVSGILSLALKCSFIYDNKLLCYFGRNSIYIYLVHNYITVALRTLYAKLGLNFPSVIYFVLCLIITLTLCTVIQQIAKKLWLLDIFFKPIKILDKICCKEKEKSENIKV